MSYYRSNWGRTHHPEARWFYVSSPRLTVAVRITNGVITDGPPIVRRFIGQPSKNLGRWMRGQGAFRWEPLS